MNKFGNLKPDTFVYIDRSLKKDKTFCVKVRIANSAIGIDGDDGYNCYFPKNHLGFILVTDIIMITNSNAVNYADLKNCKVIKF